MASKEPENPVDDEMPEDPAGDLEQKTPEKELSVRERRLKRKTAEPVKLAPKPRPRAERQAGEPPPRRRRPAPPPPKDDSKFRWLAILLIVGAIGWGAWLSWKGIEAKAIGKQYNEALAALDKLYIGCKVFWTGTGLYKSCSQVIADQILGLKNQKEDEQQVKVTVIEGDQHKFLARAQYAGNSKLFQVDKAGKIYLNTNGCLSEVVFVSLKPEDVQSLENQCSPPAQ